jgi:hypothetical protein
MSQCEVICPARSTYNAVSIRINNPKANMSDKMSNADGEGEFNAVNLEINNPELKQKPVYSYPEFDEIVTSDMAMPMIAPVAYEASYVNRTYISPAKDYKAAETVVVPEPNLTTVEDEKKNLAFNGIRFKAAQKPEITPDAGLKPAVDVDKVVGNLASADYDVQAKQLEEIVYYSLKDTKNAIPYITAPVFSELIKIASKDTSAMEGPTEEQINIRKEIITNEIYLEQQLAQNKKPEEVKLPYDVSKENFEKAVVLSEMELAERNKEYAILTLAALSKVYADEFEAKTGNVVPLTDLPGASAIVEAIRNSDNPSVKAAAIESLVYINRPEYKEEISAVLKIAANDKNKNVAALASESLKNLQ